MEELAKLCEKDGNSDASYSSPTTTLLICTDHDAQSQGIDDDNVDPSTISPLFPSQKLYSLDQIYSVSKGSHLKNGIKFLLHMCTTHLTLLSGHHRKLIEQVTSTGVILNAINFPRGALGKNY